MSSDNLITMEELKASMCKWPHGDPQEDNFHFCGEKREPSTSYCAEHNGMAYRGTTHKKDGAKG